ncbi:uncharacterized protein DC041_0003645 [Schistosoma bovis]|uniref:AGC-kinase C-terminal domain-containing protein n=1 Tax=Schistosoma bovis TaxID=6184 RepID=A0A430Q996_SCHBO|nr:uncharacterized protein DC041_0003645 [Schistosoma bovis]
MSRPIMIMTIISVMINTISKSLSIKVIRVGILINLYELFMFNPSIFFFHLYTPPHNHTHSTFSPPFQASEPIKIYMKTLKGIDALGLAQNKYISLKALQFIRRLCRFNPSERLGVGKYGIQEIRSHKYFQGFDWAGIVKQTLTTPFRVKIEKECEELRDKLVASTHKLSQLEGDISRLNLSKRSDSDRTCFSDHIHIRSAQSTQSSDTLNPKFPRCSPDSTYPSPFGLGNRQSHFNFPKRSEISSSNLFLAHTSRKSPTKMLLPNHFLNNSLRNLSKISSKPLYK